MSMVWVVVGGVGIVDVGDTSGPRVELIVGEPVTGRGQNVGS